MRFAKHLVVLSILYGLQAFGQDSLHVRTLGSIAARSDWLQYAVIQDSLAYVAEGDSGLRIISMTHTGGPSVVGQYSDGEFVQAVALCASYACIIESSTLQVLDISIPQQPVLVGSCALSAMMPWNVTAEGHYAYVSDLLEGFWIIDLTNPSSPAEVGHWPGVGSWDVAVAGDYAYVAYDMDGLRVVDISDPTQPITVGSWPAQGFGIDVSVDVRGNFAYVTDILSLLVIDISDPHFPTEVCGLTQPNYTAEVITSRHYAFVADGWAGLRIFDVINPASPVLVGYYNTPGNAFGVAVSGSIACVADSSSTRFYDVSYFIPYIPPQAPRRLAMNTAPQNGVVRLRWLPVTTDTANAPLRAIDHYTIYRSANADSGAWDSIGVPVPPDTTVFVDSTATGEREFYQVRASTE